MQRKMRKIIAFLLVCILTLSCFCSEGLSMTANATTGYKTLYFIDNTKEQWVKHDSAVMELVDNTNGHDHYWMTQKDDVTWYVTVPESAYNITFNRFNPDKTVQWNSWSAGGRDSNNAYFADGAEYGHWGIKEETAVDIDIEKDSDKDLLPDFMEDYFGCDNTKEDTDGDGLPDYIEVYSLVLDPTLADTDRNGVNDGEEDIDGEGLTNINEVKNGTSIVESDSDTDGLSDYEETVNYRTNPLKEDSDGDGAKDGKEMELGTNPLLADDSFSVSVTAKELDSVKVSVETDLSGSQVDTLKVQRYENEFLFPEHMPGYIGGAYDFQVEGTFDRATLRFEFDEEL